MAVAAGCRSRIWFELSSRRHHFCTHLVLVGPLGLVWLHASHLIHTSHSRVQKW